MSPSFLVDSDVGSAYLKGVDLAVRDRWMLTPAARIAICSVVRGELESGAWGMSDPYGMLARIERLLGPHPSIPYDDRSAAEYGRLSAELRRTGAQVGVADMVIAAIALSHGLTVVTRNLKHFKRVSGLKVVRW